MHVHLPPRSVAFVECILIDSQRLLGINSAFLVGVWTSVEEC